MTDFLSQNNINEINIGIISGVSSALLLGFFVWIKTKIVFCSNERKIINLLKKLEEDTRLRSAACYPVRISKVCVDLKMSLKEVEETMNKSEKIGYFLSDEIRLRLNHNIYKP